MEKDSRLNQKSSLGVPRADAESTHGILSSMITPTIVPARQHTSRFQRNRTPHTVVVFGAGASKSGGLPVTSALMDELDAWARANGRASHLKSIHDFIESYYFSFSAGTGSYPNIEDMLGLLDATEQYSRMRSGGVGFKWRPAMVRQLRSRLARLTGEFLWSFQNADIGQRTAAYRALVRRLGSDVIYVTFNYDLLLETALSLEGIEFSYSIGGNRVVVLKPHGSINWYHRNAFKIEAGEPTFDLGNNIVVYGNFDKATRGLRWVDREPVIVTPTPNKQFELFELQKIWTGISAAIHSARRLLIVGYSLPDTDRTARLVLRRAGPPHHRNRLIEAIDPSDQERRLKDRISPNLVYHRTTFEDWIAVQGP